MSDQFVGEIRTFPFNFAPVGWAMCNGQLMPISQNTALFSLLGTQFGGDGKTDFALPNLQGSVPLAAGFGTGLNSRIVGETGGSATVILKLDEIPAHSHSVQCAAAGNTSSPANAVFAGESRGNPPAYAPSPGPPAILRNSAVAITGSGQPHDNMPPYVALNLCISLQGVFPSRS
ncbi:MAG TPA: tail fiber protein [Terracidiphilus sp.]|jgi:microcystin-dependent protein|nr:tail fiber protein [Terracidiphilus sp.]